MTALQSTMMILLLSLWIITNRDPRTKQQRDGTSNQFMDVTYSMIIRLLPILPKVSLTGGISNTKQSIAYLKQSIMSANGMIGCKNVNIINGATSFITTDNSFNIPSHPNFSVEKVNGYYNMLRICYGLIHQREFSSQKEN